MEANFYHIDELAEKSTTPVHIISNWVSLGILIPDGMATDSTPIFSEDSLKTIAKIKSLLEVGYELSEVRKNYQESRTPCCSR